MRNCLSLPDVISIHAPRVGSDVMDAVPVKTVTLISIHAPRVGSDVMDAVPVQTVTLISIHAPRVGSDACMRLADSGMEVDFNPRSPCGERRD